MEFIYPISRANTVNDEAGAEKICLAEKKHDLVEKA